MRVVLRLEADGTDRVELSVAWRLLLLHGSRRRRLTPPAGAGPSAAAPRPAPTSPAASAGADRDEAARDHGRARPAARRTVRDRLADLARGSDVVRRLVARRALRVVRLDGWLEFALRDVGETGRAFGYACSLVTLLDPLGRVALRPRWDAENLLAADLRLEVRVHPLRTLPVLAGARLRRRRRARAGDAGAPAGGAVAL